MTAGCQTLSPGGKELNPETRKLVASTAKWPWNFREFQGFLGI